MDSRLSDVDDETYTDTLNAAEDSMVSSNLKILECLRQQQQHYTQPTRSRFSNASFQANANHNRNDFPGWNFSFLQNQLEQSTPQKQQQPGHQQQHQQQSQPSPQTQQQHETDFSNDGNFLGNLVEEIRNYECLWDTSCRSFKEHPKKKQAWNQIAQKLNIEVKEVQNQWAKLRENFRKCLRRREKATRSGAGKTQLPSCQYFKELQFITDSVSNRATISNVPSPASTPADVSSPDIFTPPPSPLVIDDNNGFSASTTTPVNKKRKRDLTTDVNSILLQSIQRDLSTPPAIAKPEEKDSDTLFCLSLVEDFKDLPPSKKELRESESCKLLVICMGMTRMFEYFQGSK